MPAIVVAAIVTAAATTTATVVASRSQSGSARRASDAEMSAIDQQLAFEREKEAERKAETERYNAEAKTQWDATQAKDQERYDIQQQQYTDEIARQTRLDEATLADRRAEFELAKQKYADRQAQMAPYRQAGAGALAQLATLAGVATPTAAAPALLATMPDTWQVGDPVVATSPATATSAERPSLLNNPDLLPVRLTADGTQQVQTAEAVDAALPLSTASVPAVAVAPTINADAYRTLAAPRAATSAALTPAQLADLRRAAPSSLSALARSRKARVSS